MYFDEAGNGGVTLSGFEVVCNSTEAADAWYGSWSHVYPEGPKTPMYELLRMEALSIEFVAYKRFHVDEGGARADWRPLTLERSLGGDWRYVAPLSASSARASEFVLAV